MAAGHYIRWRKTSQLYSIVYGKKEQRNVSVNSTCLRLTFSTRATILTPANNPPNLTHGVRTGGSSHLRGPQSIKQSVINDWNVMAVVARSVSSGHLSTERCISEASLAPISQSQYLQNGQHGKIRSGSERRCWRHVA
ncbi:hypothetical protein KCP70_06470 [Salmonella enterica subsp. enterica]|nr:hypothetical protein KCP70_06470 [Salmonella enterica subsp. enterica]